MANLLDLIRLGLVSPGLEVKDFFDSVSPENVMASPNALPETQPEEKPTQPLERDVRVGGTTQNLRKNFVRSWQANTPSKREG